MKKIKILEREIQNLGGEIKPSTEPGSLLITLPGKRRRRYYPRKGFWIKHEVSGLIWPRQEQWEILGYMPSREEELKALFKKCLPLWQEREKIGFSTLVEKPRRLPELYRPLVRRPNN